MSSQEIQKWADAGMYRAEEMPKDEHGIHPIVHLISMNHDPLGSIAAMNGIYKGNIVRNLTEITDDVRKYEWAQVMKAHLEAPLESIKMHFLIEGVDRGFTHQLVRQRTGTYAQETMRFAVKENMADEVVLPPHIAILDDDDPVRVVWDKAVENIGEAYNGLVNSGVPAEDARGILPTATSTRIHYLTDLRGLKLHAGNRLCTQAQFHWRLVLSAIVNSIRNYGHQLVGESWVTSTGQHMDDLPISPGDPDYEKMYQQMNGWQYEMIADSMIFRPVCYHLGRCPWRDDLAAIRTCSIRDRVDKFSDAGLPSSKWEDRHATWERAAIHPIKPAEWLADPDSAIRDQQHFQEHGKSV